MSTGIGQTLREAREAQGRTHQDAAESLRVRSDYIDALETEQFDIFGADTYARGHLRNYAIFLGLDPAPLLAAYDRDVRREDVTVHQVVDAPIAVTNREPLPRWITVLGLGVLALGAVALIGVLGNNTPPPADPGLARNPTVGPTDATEPVDPNPTEPPTQAPTQTPTFDGIELLMVVEADCWVDIEVDGVQHPRSQSVLTAGDTLTIQGESLIEITYGNAGGVLIEVNGESYGRPGGNGAVVEVAYDPEGPVADGAAAA